MVVIHSSFCFQICSFQSKQCFLKLLGKQLPPPPPLERLCHTFAKKLDLFVFLYSILGSRYILTDLLKDVLAYTEVHICDVHFMDFYKCIVSHICHSTSIQFYHPQNSLVCPLLFHLCPLTQILATNDLFSIPIHFPEGQTSEIIQSVAFSV